MAGIYDKYDGTMSDHEPFCIHYDLFDRNKSTCQDENIMRKFISNKPNENESLSKSTEKCEDKI